MDNSRLDILYNIAKHDRIYIKCLTAEAADYKILEQEGYIEEFETTNPLATAYQLTQKGAQILRDTTVPLITYNSRDPDKVFSIIIFDTHIPFGFYRFPVKDHIEYNGLFVALRLMSLWDIAIRPKEAEIWDTI